MNDKKTSLGIINAILAFTLAVTLILLSVQIVLRFTPFYNYHIQKYNLTSRTHLNSEQIQQEYQYLVQYLTDSNSAEFNLRYLPYSKQGKIHFEDVRNIFMSIEKIQVGALLFSIGMLVIQIRRRDYGFLRGLYRWLLGIPVLVSLPLILDFEHSFIIFHKLLFRNDYWIFDPDKDPIIHLLPQQFFMNAAFFIIAIIFFYAILSFLMLRIVEKRIIVKEVLR